MAGTGRFWARVRQIRVLPYAMERILLAVVTVVGALAPLAASGWSWLSALGTFVVGTVGFVVSLRAEGRAAREEARAERAERRAEAAERRADEAEQRDREVYEWERERRREEEERCRARTRVEHWVIAKKKAHGTAPFRVELAELDLARAAQDAGLVTLKELLSSGGVADAMAWVSGAVVADAG